MPCATDGGEQNQLLQRYARRTRTRARVAERGRLGQAGFTAAKPAVADELTGPTAPEPWAELWGACSVPTCSAARRAARAGCRWRQSRRSVGRWWWCGGDARTLSAALRDHRLMATARNARGPVSCCPTVSYPEPRSAHQRLLGCRRIWLPPISNVRLATITRRHG